MALAVCGPTASGKSAAVARAAALVGGEIINADSRQIYQGTSVGTGWPDRETTALAPHHGYGVVPLWDRYNAGRFVRDAARMIERIIARNRVPILVGGTGLYIEALAGTMPLDRPVADDAIKERVRSETAFHDQSTLHAWLASLSPQAAARLPAGDAYRTTRALEAALSQRAGTNAADSLRPAIDLRIVIVDVQRAALNPRIAARTEAMFNGGLVDEALRIRERYAAAPALSGLGYAEALAYHDGAATRDEAVREAVRRTQRYARRQRMWFRRMRDARLIDATKLAADDVAEAIAREAREISLPA